MVGLPYSLNGAIGKQAEKVLSFTRQIAQVTDIEIIMQDERLTSVSANQKLRPERRAANSRAKWMRLRPPSILQSYLDEVRLNGQISQLEPPTI